MGKEAEEKGKERIKEEKRASHLVILSFPFSSRFSHFLSFTRIKEGESDEQIRKRKERMKEKKDKEPHNAIHSPFASSSSS